MQFCTPLTTPALALAAQDKLLKQFLRRSSFEVKSTKQHGLNYVVIRRKESTEDKARLPSPSFPVDRFQQQHTQHTHTTHRHQYHQLHSQQRPKRTLVLMHGYGLGLGFFYNNLDDLASHFDEVVAVDWLGMGCSSRVSTKVARLSTLSSLLPFVEQETSAKETAEQVASQFVESLDEVRHAEGIQEFVLAGHSLGGYLSGKYALRYPQHVKGLVMISPAGIPTPPHPSERAQPDELDWRVRILSNLWNLNFTPQSVIRIAGSRGPKFIESAFRRRFSSSKGRWSEEDARILSDYLFHITAAPGNGEFALNTLLQPIFVKNHTEVRRLKNSTDSKPHKRSGVYARNALEHDIKDNLSRNIPVLVLFGDQDWLYFPEAPHTINTWRDHGIRADLHIIPHAGHHLQMENAVYLNKTIIDWTKQIMT